MNEYGDIRPADDAPRARKLKAETRIRNLPPALPTRVYVVMVEQHYANHVSLRGAFSTLEKAEKYKESLRLGNDVVIYEIELDDEDFIA